MGDFEDLMQRIVGADEDRQALLNIAGKYPALKTAVMAQDDYSRKLNDHDRDLKELGAWRRWKIGGVDPETGKAIESSWDEEAGTTKSEKLMRQQLEAANQRMLELEAAGGGDVNFDQVMEALGKRGYMTATDFEQKIKPGLLDRQTYNDDVLKRLNAQGAAYEAAFAQGIPMAVRHFKDFNGEVVDMPGLLDYMGKNKLTSLDEAYNKMYEPRLNELRTKRDQDREATIRKEEREKTLQEQAQANQGRGNPVDNTGGTREYGHLEARKIAAAKSAEDKPALAGAELGQNTIAALAAEEFRKNPAAFQKAQ